MTLSGDHNLHDLSLEELLTRFAERVCFEQQQQGLHDYASRIATHYPGLFVEWLPKNMLAALQSAPHEADADKIAVLKRYCITRLQTPLSHASKFRAPSPFKAGTVTDLPVPYQLRIAQEGESQFAQPHNRTSLALGNLNTFLQHATAKEHLDKVGADAEYYDTHTVTRERGIRTLMMPIAMRELELCFGERTAQRGRS